jgi:hypothetical protein
LVFLFQRSKKHPALGPVTSRSNLDLIEILVR